MCPLPRALALLALLSAAAIGLDAARPTTAFPAPQAPPAQPGAAETPAAAPTVGVTASRVAVDLVVRDKKGRLVRDLGVSSALPGYNQVWWDGRDSDGNLLPNGVYLYVMNATSFDGAESQSVVVRDRLLVLR